MPRPQAGRGRRSRSAGRRLRVRRGHRPRCLRSIARDSTGTVRALWQVPHPAGPAPRAEAVRRFPERRDGRGPASGRARGLRVHRARQALHGIGLRHGPGQDFQHQRHGHRGAGRVPADRRGRHDDVPPELHARHLRSAGRTGAGRRIRSGSRHADARLACASRREVRGRGAVEACLVFPRGRRGPPRGRAPRGAGRAQRCRHARRLHARQDRRAGTGRRGAAQLGLLQRLEQARGGQVPLRADARRERHGVRRRRDGPARRAPLPDAYDDGWRRPRARVDGALAADRMAAAEGLPDLGHRSLGHDRARRAEEPGRAPEGLCRRRLRRCRIPVHVVSRGNGGRRAGAHHAHQLLRRARLRGQRARARRAAGLGGAVRGGPRVRHHALWHRDHARAAGREGLHHRGAGHGRIRDAGRPRHGGHGGPDQGLHRQALARTQ